MRLIKTEQLPFGNQSTYEITAENLIARRARAKLNAPESTESYIGAGYTIIERRSDGSALIQSYTSIGD